MTYRFADFVHTLSINGELILLDEKSDQYLFLSSEDTHHLSQAIAGKEDIDDTARELLDLGILQPSDQPGGWPQDEKTLHGVDSYQWRFRSDYVKPIKSGFLDRIRSLLVLYPACRRLRRRGFHEALNALRNQKKNCTDLQPDTDRAEDLAAHLSSVALLIPGRVYCLEMSLALTSFCLANGVAADFVIGVQRYSFLAHAWVETDGKVVADRPDLNINLHQMMRI